MSGRTPRCPKCGAAVYPTDNVCLQCGAELRVEELLLQTAPPPASPLAPQPPPVTFSSALAPQAPAYVPAAGPGVRTAPAGYWTRPGAYAPHVTGYGGGGGFFESISRAWTFLNESVAMCFRDRDLILPSVFAVLASILIFAVMAAVGFLFSGLREAALEQKTVDQTLMRTVLISAGLAGSLLMMLVNYLFAGMTVNMVDVHLSGRDATLREAWRDAMKNLGAILSLAVISLVVRTLIGSLRGRNRGFGIGEFIASGLDRIWTVATYLLLPIIILEDTSLKNAAVRATQIHRQSIIGIVVGEVGVGVLSGLLTFGVLVLGIGGSYLLYQLGTVALIVGIVLAALALAVVAAFSTYVRTAFYTCLYLWAVAREAVGEMAPAPAPLAAAVA